MRNEISKIKMNPTKMDNFPTKHFIEPQKTIEELIKKKISFRESTQLFCLLLQSLEQFHKQQQCHLELYPDNIMLCGNQIILPMPERIHKLDAASQGEKRRVQYPKVRIKYETYLAPEVRLRKILQIHYRSDIYSACAIFYTLLTGMPPQLEAFFSGERNWKLGRDLPVFQGESEQAIALAMKIIRGGLQPLPLKRYQSIDAVMPDLELLLKELSMGDETMQNGMIQDIVSSTEIQ